jgi:ubiquinone/menaquinone biosynthesis C-methylase UbiE
MIENKDRQDKEKHIWERIASSYDRNTLKTYHKAYDETIRRIRALISQDQRVLEIGCGTGIVTLAVAPHVEEIVGVDISPKMMEIAQAKAQRMSIENARFTVCDGYTLPYEDEYFDRVLLCNILHVVSEPSTLLKEACRLCKSDGYVITATDCYAEPASFSARIALGVEWVLKQIGAIPVIEFYKKEHLHRLLEQAGLEIIETQILHPSPVNYYILARKNEAERIG